MAEYRFVLLGKNAEGDWSYLDGYETDTWSDAENTFSKYSLPRTLRQNQEHEEVRIVRYRTSERSTSDIVVRDYSVVTPEERVLKRK